MNDTAAIGWSSSVSAIAPPPSSSVSASPAPASRKHWASACAHAIAAEAGFHSTGLPHTIAGASFHAGIASGKFHGVISTVGPIARRRVRIATPGSSEGISAPFARRVSCA